MKHLVIAAAIVAATAATANAGEWVKETIYKDVIRSALAHLLVVLICSLEHCSEALSVIISVMARAMVLPVL